MMTSTDEMPALTSEELLTTTRCVRRRLDLQRPVDKQLITECIQIAQQAPSGSNLQLVHLIVVTDPDKRAALGQLWSRAAEAYKEMDASVYKLSYGDPRDAGTPRIISSFEYMSEHLAEVPVHVVPCIAFRPPREGGSTFLDSTIWGSVHPLMWSLMLAARSKGLASCYTTIHLMFEEEAAEILGVPYPEVMQAGLIPLAHSIGQNYRAAYRVPTESITHWDSW